MTRELELELEKLRKQAFFPNVPNSEKKFKRFSIKIMDNKSLGKLKKKGKLILNKYFCAKRGKKTRMKGLEISDGIVIFQ